MSHADAAALLRPLFDTTLGSDFLSSRSLSHLRGCVNAAEMVMTVGVNVSVNGRLTLC